MGAECLICGKEIKEELEDNDLEIFVRNKDLFLDPYHESCIRKAIRLYKTILWLREQEQ